MKHSISGSVLEINNKKVDFRIRIDSVIEIEDLLIVLVVFLSSEEDKQFQAEDVLDNVYGVTACGEIKWRIQNAKEHYPLLKRIPYVGIYRQDNDLSVTDFNGFRFLVEPPTGKILERLENTR